MTSGHGVLQRRHTVPPRSQPDVGAGGHQHPHGVDIAPRTIAEDDRLVERGPAKIVDVVDLNPGLHQPTGDVGVAPVGRPDQTRAVEGVLGRNVAAMPEGQLEQLQEPLAGRDQEGALHRFVGGIDVSESS